MTTASTPHPPRSPMCAHGRWRDTCFCCFLAGRSVPENPSNGSHYARARGASRKPTRTRAFERGFSGTSRRGGRPHKSDEEKRRTNRERVRRQRERRQAEEGGAR